MRKEVVLKLEERLKTEWPLSGPERTDCSCIDEGYFETVKEMKKRGVEVVPGCQLPWFASERREKRGLK
jgi:hypothetical protein